MIACRPFSRRCLSFVPILGGNKDGQSSLGNSKRQKIVQVWRPNSTESAHISKVVKDGFSDPFKDTISYEKSTFDESADSLDVTLSGAVSRESKSITLKGEEAVPFSCIGTTMLKSNSERVNRTGKHSVSIQVEAPLIRFVKGKWGLTQRQIERETGVKIIVPSAKGDSSIVIEGDSGENVTRASEKITNLLEQAVENPSLDYSHFVSLPLAIYPELAEKLRSFQKYVLEEVGEVRESDMEGSSSDGIPEENVSDSQLLEALGIDSSIFIKPQTFHLTVLMLKLWTKDRVAIATEVLKGVSSKAIDALENRPVSIRLKGLACMRGSKAKARVLYAPVEEVGGEGRLSRACQVIIDAFVEAGLVAQKDAHHSLKLHATLMNARHRKSKDWGKRQEYFDARGIFKRYGSEDWGEYVIAAAHLSQRYLFDESGYYHCCASIPFPGSTKID